MMTDQEIVEIAKKGIADETLTWAGFQFQKDEGGRYTIPVISPYYLKLIQHVLAVQQARAAAPLTMHYARIKGGYSWTEVPDLTMEAPPGFEMEFRSYGAVAPQQAAPVTATGWKLMPPDATEAMMHAAEDIAAPRPYGAVYRAMFAVAPPANDWCPECHARESMPDDAPAALLDDARDAERYRWLRDNTKRKFDAEFKTPSSDPAESDTTYHHGFSWVGPTDHLFDMMIDAAIAAKAPT